MPARNVHHDAVVEALISDGWTITHDPLTITYGGKDLFVDLGAERAALAAEKEGRRIAVEIQSFFNPSPVRDLQEAVGQYQVYRAVLSETQPDRQIYLAGSASRARNATLRALRAIHRESTRPKTPRLRLKTALSSVWRC
jgi:hypothetical protein